MGPSRDPRCGICHTSKNSQCRRPRSRQSRLVEGASVRDVVRESGASIGTTAAVRREFVAGLGGLPIRARRTRSRRPVPATRGRAEEGYAGTSSNNKEPRRGVPGRGDSVRPPSGKSGREITSALVTALLNRQMHARQGTDGYRRRHRLCTEWRPKGQLPFTASRLTPRPTASLPLCTDLVLPPRRPLDCSPVATSWLAPEPVGVKVPLYHRATLTPDQSACRQVDA